jgi:hypothetical protein
LLPVLSTKNPDTSLFSPWWTTLFLPTMLSVMKHRKKKPPDLLERFETTCGWCRKKIPRDTEVFGSGVKFRPGTDFSHLAGQVIRVYLAIPDKTLLVGVAGLDSEAKRDGCDFVCMTCSAACAGLLREAFQGEIKLADSLGLP